VSVRTQTPTYEPLRSQHVDALLDKAGSLLTHSLKLSEALERLGDLLVPQFADWCSLALLDEQHDEWRLVLTRTGDPALDSLREKAEGLFGAWTNSGSFSQRVLSGGQPLLVSHVSEEWLRTELSDERIVELARAMKVRSALYLPLELDGKLLGSLLLLVLGEHRAGYQEEDLRSARRLATFVAAALRNAKLWGALQIELSERRRIERSLRANVMTIRTLAAGVGHDIGNLLQPLRLRLDSLSTMRLPSMAVTDHKAIAGVVGYLQRLTSGLRLLAGDPRAALTSQDVTPLATWWRDVEAVMKDALPPGVVLECDLATRLPPARIPPAALTHIIFNLVQNAGQSVNGQSYGTVRIWAERPAKRKTLRFAVEDNGPGMDAESIRYCFDPFHDTGTRSNATRIGLPLVHALVHRAGGEIAVHSRKGEGTKFLFTLPLAERRSRPRRGSSLARVVRVTVEDEGTSKTVEDIVRGAGFYVDQTEGLLHGQPQVWITDLASASRPDELIEFVVEGESRLAVIVNAHHAPLPHPRIHVLESVVDGGGLRAVLDSYEAPRPRRSRGRSPAASSRPPND
jgi:signal transduction histidine kinase